MSQLLTVNEAARMLACTPAAVRKWLYQRRLPCVKIGRLVRLRLEDVQRVAANGLSPAGTACQPTRRASGRPQKRCSDQSDADGRQEPASAAVEAAAKGS